MNPNNPAKRAKAMQAPPLITPESIVKDLLPDPRPRKPSQIARASQPSNEPENASSVGPFTLTAKEPEYVLRRRHDDICERKLAWWHGLVWGWCIGVFTTLAVIELAKWTVEL